MHHASDDQQLPEDRCRRIVRTSGEFTDKELESIARSEPPAEAAAFDHEYKQA